VFYINQQVALILGIRWLFSRKINEIIKTSSITKDFFHSKFTFTESMLQ